MTTVILRRLRTQAGRQAQVCVRGVYRPAPDADTIQIPMGPVGEGAWWDVPLPPCPDCGGDLVWWEAGYVPGTRRCLGAPLRVGPDGEGVYDVEGGCGSLFTVDVEEEQR